MQTGAGGLLRDHEGNWLTGFAQSLGICTALKAELWSILIGLRTVLHLNIPKLIVESDSSLAVEAVNRRTVLFGNCSHLVNAIQQLLQGHWEVSYVFVGRQGNGCADWLAKEASLNIVDLNIFHSPPMGLVHLLQSDSASSSSVS